ncbi:MAG: hypothetical protein ACD_36C00134G0004 [uncultured bacterium]|uniref:alanine--tRNA ligase n=1 Tax=Candidatus Gottesmanbacteria bacterium RIFCSPLOWO2_01_FULL_43_11b TaxID=1798392 RepID=A0A1F6AIG1_9BACT|nr:MAG: hypothetical protein ACD_36C00134G0004 [uncultured bacterium]OGG24262.1 MAG: hypothetical protein A3A79_03685 [Candidatus Gottesmanbacteria bacterium RIFCSPLOWO2_01_FULL_43_11b]
MKSSDVRRKYIEFFKARGHVEIPSAPLVPENDSTTLFTSSGMQPLVPYLLGESHPLGKRLVNSQKSFRAGDIEEVGDNRHTTFFEMLGNWSFGDYFKKEQLPWIWEFLTKELHLPKEKLYVSVFEGNKDVPKDEESAGIWKKLGIPDSRLFYYGVDKNWWSRSGEPDKMPAGEPGGPDSEVFFDFEKPIHDGCHPNCNCGRFLEIANSVFMQYQKQKDGSIVELPNKNVDFGGGLERLTAATNNDPDVFNIDIFFGAKKLLKEDKKNVRVVLDHVRAAMFIIDAGVLPSNKTQGYILRRLIRRAAVHSKATLQVLNEFIQFYGLPSSEQISKIFSDELTRFDAVLEKGMKMVGNVPPFDLFQTYGFPPEIIQELFKQKGLNFDKYDFEEKFKTHQNLSRTAAAGMFKGGLADQSEQTVKLHTTHHLLLASLQKIVDPSIKQRGSNITAERLRMDFNFERKLTPEEIKKIETLVNEKIKENLKVSRVEMTREEAEKIGAQMEFGHKYPDRVSVYFVGPASPAGGPKEEYFSAEFCGGPHVSFTGAIGRFTIMKEESAGAGIRRIYAGISTDETSKPNPESLSTKTGD